MKISKLISQVKTSNKQLFDDNLISDRYIYNIAKSITSVLVKREINARKLLNSDSIFTPLECIKLEEVTLNKCGIDSCNTAMRSKITLPKLEEGIYGYTIQGVYNVDNSEEIYPTTIREYINSSKLRFTSNKLKYLIKDSRLYILNKDIESVNIYLYSVEDFTTDTCNNYEKELKIPSYLEKSLYDLINQEILNYINKPKDVTDNNLEERQ